MLQSIVHIVHDCANQIIMVVLQSPLHTVIELVNQRAALLIVLEKDKGSNRSVWFVHRQRPATWHPCAGRRKIIGPTIILFETTPWLVVQSVTPVML